MFEKRIFQIRNEGVGGSNPSCGTKWPPALQAAGGGKKGLWQARSLGIGDRQNLRVVTQRQRDGTYVGERPDGRDSGRRIVNLHRSMGGGEIDRNIVHGSGRPLVPDSEIESAFALLHEEVMHGRRLRRDRIV